MLHQGQKEVKERKVERSKGEKRIARIYPSYEKDQLSLLEWVTVTDDDEAEGDCVESAKDAFVVVASLVCEAAEFPSSKRANVSAKYKALSASHRSSHSSSLDI